MRSNVTKSAVNVAFGTNRKFTHTRTAKSLCAFVLRQRSYAIARLSVGDCSREMCIGLAMPPRLARPYHEPVSADGRYRNGRLVSIGTRLRAWQRSVN